MPGMASKLPRNHSLPGVFSEAREAEHYHWYYVHRKGEPAQTMQMASEAARKVAYIEACETGITHIVAVKFKPRPSLHVFSAGHPEIAKSAFTKMIEVTGHGKIIEHDIPKAAS